VAIDGRTDLYGDEIDFRFIKTERGDPSYVEDPYARGHDAQCLRAPACRHGPTPFQQY